jgi:hypothetical protein
MRELVISRPQAAEAFVMRLMSALIKATAAITAVRAAIKPRMATERPGNPWDQGYNEGRLAFRRYFAEYGPNVKQNDPRMRPNPYVAPGLRGSTGSSPNCAATSSLLQALANSATSRSGFAFGLRPRG